MSESEARERYYWSKIRQAIKCCGDVEGAAIWLQYACAENGQLYKNLRNRIRDTFTAGCIALGDPAPLDKERDHE